MDGEGDDPTASSGGPPGEVTRRWAVNDPSTVDRRVASAEHEPPVHARYAHRDLIGRGGQGVVFRVHDRELGRDVALKTVYRRRFSPEESQAFIEEVNAAASLEHPNIIPIYDSGLLDDGRPFYTMRLVSGRSLAQVLHEEDGAGQASSEWSLTRLVQAVQQTCLALEMAHGRGVLHRDVKPSNILLGPHGEVLLVDWGIAKITTSLRVRTDSDILKLTAAYASPEQACGDTLDARTDLYSLGVVLYQILAGRLPFAQETRAEILAAVLRDEPPPPEQVAPDRVVPPELSALALRALAKDAAARPQTARALHDELQAFLEGVRDRERRAAGAAALCEEAEGAVRRHAEARARVAEREADVERLQRVHPAWQPIAEKRPLLDARRALAASVDDVEASYLEAVEHYTDALAHLSTHVAARRGLTDLYWERFRQSERDGDVAAARALRLMVERFHDGRLEHELRGDGSLELEVDPPSAELTLHPLIERDLVLVDGPGRQLGRGSVSIDALPMGSYVIVAHADGFEPARYPVCIARSDAWRGKLRLLEKGALPPGFVYVPATEAWLGGDSRATNSWPLRRVTIGSFAIAKHPVTFGEYCEFLDSLGDDALVAEHLPRVETEGALVARVGARYEPRIDVLLSDGLATRHGDGASIRLPVVGVSRTDAEAYAAWRSRELRVRCRLPTAEEWELASRGVDRRRHPWGDPFDAALSYVRDSVPGRPEIAPIGVAEADESVYGVRDMAGCVQEWTASWLDEPRTFAEVRGGGWSMSGSMSRCAWRGAAGVVTRGVVLGFRLGVEISSA